MYPLTDQTLTLSQIAQHWFECPTPTPPLERIRERMLQDFWHNYYIPYRNAPFTREYALKILPCDDHKGIEIIHEPKPDDDIRDWKGESITVDLTNYILLPTEHEKWTRKIIDTVCQVLAKCRIEDYSSDFLIGFFLQLLGRREFLDYCDLAGYARPTFWNDGVRHRPVRTIKAKTQTREWLTSEVRKGPKRQKKLYYFQEAKQRFPGLSKRAFFTIWADTVPDDWKRSGAPKKS